MPRIWNPRLTLAASYVATSKHVDLSSCELVLANLSVDYLNMPGFRRDTPDITALALRGYYGFMDYAVAHWVRYVEEAASGADEGDAMIKDLAESLMALLDLHFTAPTKHLPVSKGNKERLQVFESLARFHDLEEAVVWARKELTFFGEARESERALDLGFVVGNVRSELERAINGAGNGTSKDAHDLEAMYGPKPFKCSRLSCRYFYDGFTTAQQREQHHDKHLLPFRCTVVGCPRSSLGMASKRELEKHIRDTHMAPEDDDFPDLDEPSAEEEPVAPEDDESSSLDEPSGQGGTARPAISQRHEAAPKAKRPRVTEWTCDVCSKVFRKKFNLQSHMATHSNEREFCCRMCDLSFARASDRNRHEKTHQEPGFTCGGELPDGQRWGCGQKFVRADTLQNHLRTAAGQACLRMAPNGGV